jgi:hypothetical protein
MVVADAIFEAQSLVTASRVMHSCCRRCVLPVLQSTMIFLMLVCATHDATLIGEAQRILKDRSYASSWRLAPRTQSSDPGQGLCTALTNPRVCESQFHFFSLIHELQM